VFAQRRAHYSIRRFAKMWKLSSEALREQPAYRDRGSLVQTCSMTRDVARAPRSHYRDRETGSRCRLKLERKDGSVLDCMTMPLPDGATMLTFPGHHRYEKRRAGAARA